MNKRQIATQLRAARVSGRQLSATLSGKFIPVNVSRTVQKNIFDNNLRSEFPVKEVPWAPRRKFPNASGRGGITARKKCVLHVY